MTPDKPYNRCITCGKIGVNCDGPNFLAMSGDHWLEWVKLRKKYLGWSNADIAEQAQVSKTTVDRIFSGHGGGSPHLHHGGDHKGAGQQDVGAIPLRRPRRRPQQRIFENH